MPECVKQFAETGNYTLVRHTQDTILTSYLNDMSKYNHLNEIKKTRLAYDNITVQLSRKNTRFQYKLLKKGGRAAEFEPPAALREKGAAAQRYFLYGGGA